jgi:hypothetical protein
MATNSSAVQVLNHDIASLVRRLRRFKEEVVKSISSNVAELNGHDLKRLVTYLEALKAFKSWMVSQPILDLPETSPLTIDLGSMPDMGQLENDDLAVILQMFNLIEQEIVNSQSARRSTGLVSHDSIRFDTYISKIENFINDYILKTNPLDLPESAPAIPITGPGRTGI